MEILFKDKLSTKSKKSLIGCFGEDVLDNPEVIADAGAEILKTTVPIGPVTIREIALLLYFYGYVDNPVKWLER